MGENINLTAKDGVTIGAYRSAPEDEPKGGMVVLQEIFGVNHHIRAVADRYAAAGYLAIAPALFDRVEPGVELGYGEADRPRAMEIRGKTKLEETLADIEAAVALAAAGGSVGVVGYCWGGTLAWAAATRLSDISAAVGYYGGGIANMVQDANDAAIVRAIVTLGHSLELAVVAEGVETADQLAKLREEGCDEVQGFYFGRPMPAAQFQQVLAGDVPLARSA